MPRYPINQYPYYLINSNPYFNPNVNMNNNELIDRSIVKNRAFSS